MKKAILLLLAVMCLPGCSALLGEPCEEKWTKTYNARGDVLYVKEETQCVSIRSKEIYQ